ncbi:MAG TPA: hypothetical protein VFR32_11360, partial [Gaiellaceae bacterium]|nr:hypothetical protein [Gaiellaceae bacterium]
AVRRLGESPIGVLATLRGGPDEPDPLRLAEAFDSEFSEVAIGPLSVDTLQRLVRKRFEVRIPRSKLASVHAASGGNPMFALEFARAAEREDADLRAQLPVPSSLQELVRDRIRGLPDSTRPLLELVSAIERPTPSLLAKALGETPADALTDEAASAGAVALGADGVVRFTHPLLGSAVYFGMPAGRRRALHLEVAGLVDDLEQQARHLALGTPEPDEAVADLVEQAARAAARRGAPDAAATLAAGAVRLTPPEDEPSRARRTFVEAGFLMEAGDVAEAGARVRPLLDPSVPAAIRSQALVTRAETEHTNRLNLQTYLQEAIDIAPDPHVRWVAWMRHAQMGGWISADARTAAESAREALDIAVELGDPGRIAASTAALAFYEAARGSRDISFGEAELAAFGEAELAAPEELRPAPWQITPAISVGARLLWAGELDRARAVLRHEYDELVRRGSILRLPLNLMAMLSDVEWRGGRSAAADAYAKDARAILEDAMPGARTWSAMRRSSLPGHWAAWRRPALSPPPICKLPCATGT